MGVVSFLLIAVAVPIGIIVLLVHLISFVFWLIRGVFSLLLLILTPFKWLLYSILVLLGIVWVTSD